MEWEGNHIVDGDDGSHSSSPLHNPGFECCYCNGTGKTHTSCCGDDISSTIDESDLCPTCLEHCDTEGDTCESCDGTGYMSEDKHYDLHHDY
jgi:hypothetical protein